MCSVRSEIKESWPTLCCGVTKLTLDLKGQPFSIIGTYVADPVTDTELYLTVAALRGQRRRPTMMSFTANCKLD